MPKFRAYKLNGHGFPVWTYGNRTWNMPDELSVKQEIFVYTAGVELPESATGELVVVREGSAEDLAFREQRKELIRDAVVGAEKVVEIGSEAAQARRAPEAITEPSQPELFEIKPEKVERYEPTSEKERRRMVG
jgi:hypothetical protein